jgi:DNA-directed RNA polymerase subunit RPC12/RpoP
MVTLLKATFECGFESDHIHLGFGMFGHGSYCNAPAVCLNCNMFLEKDYYKKYSKCPKCRKKVVFYNDESVQKEKSKKTDNEKNDDDFSWGMPDEEKYFKLPDTNYYCPACGKMTMKFSFAGCWD